MSYKGNNSSSSDDDDDEMETDPQIPPLYGPPSSNRGIRQIIDPNSVQMPQLYRRTEPTERPSLRSQFPSPGSSAPVSGLKRSLKSDLPHPKRRLRPLSQPTSQITGQRETPQSTITRNKWDYTRPSDQLPDIVQKYRNPYTCEPDLNVMRKDIDIEKGQLEYKSRPLHETLSLRHKRRTLDIKKEIDGKRDRQKQQMKNMGYNLDQKTGRYIKEGGGTTGSQITTTPTATTGRQTPRLERSQSMPDLSALGEVSGKISEMGSQRRSQIMPTGRLGYGMRWSPELSRRFSADDSSLTTGKFFGEDLSYYTPKERAFSTRLKNRSVDELKIYKHYRNMADPMHKDQAVARKRMHRISSPFGQYEADSARVKNIQDIQSKILRSEKPPPNVPVKDMRDFRRFMSRYQRLVPSTRIQDNGKLMRLQPILESRFDTLQPSAAMETKQLQSYDQRFQQEIRKIKERSTPSMFGQIHEEVDDEAEEEEEPMETEIEEPKSDYEQWLKNYQQRQHPPKGGPRDKSPEPPTKPDSCSTQ